jgi:hypothetical protein
MWRFGVVSLLFRWILAVSILLNSVNAQQQDCAAMQARIQQQFKGAVESHRGQQPCVLMGDFDGDGAADIASLVRIRSASPADATTVVANPWSRDPNRKISRGDIAIAVVFARGSSYLVGDKEFFATPMWQSPVSLLSVRKRRTLTVATESGEDMVLRWTGRAWTITVAPE